jgi:hypothetical protein
VALDRFVYWRDERPTFDEVVRVVRNTLGYAGSIDLRDDEVQSAEELQWITVSLPGKPTHALEGIAPNVSSESLSTERWFEVVVHGDRCVDVLTRMQDQFTNAVAKSVAETLRRYWDGSDEPPVDARSAHDGQQA